MGGFVRDNKKNFFREIEKKQTPKPNDSVGPLQGESGDLIIQKNEIAELLNTDYIWHLSFRKMLNQAFPRYFELQLPEFLLGTLQVIEQESQFGITVKVLA